VRHNPLDRRGGIVGSVLYLIVALLVVIFFYVKAADFGFPEQTWISILVAALFGQWLVVRLGRRRPSLARPIPSAPREAAVSAPSEDDARERPVRPGPAPPPVDPRSIAILPFRIEGPDPTIEHLADGIAEEVLVGLAGLGGARVTARASSFRFRDGNPDLALIGRQLGVAHVLQGSISRAAGRLAVEVVLRTTLGARVWSQRTECGLGAVHEAQEALVRGVAGSLGYGLPEGGSALSAGRRTSDPVAQDHYLKGRAFWHGRGTGLRQSATFFEQAVHADADFALAWAGRADAHIMLGFYGYMEPHAAFKIARESAEKALQLDDRVAEAWSALGFVRTFHDWDWVRADLCFQKAVDLNPSSMLARRWYAMNRGIVGRLGDWLRQNQSSLVVDPLAVFSHAHVAWSLLGARAYDEAEAAAQRALELDEDFALGYWFRWRAHLYRGNLDAAVSDLIESARRARGNPIVVSTLGYAVGKSGDMVRAQRHLEDLKAGPPRWRWVGASQIATVQLGLERTGDALTTLERAASERDFWLPMTIRRPEWDGVRHDPRFKAILEQTGPGGDSPGELLRGPRRDRRLSRRAHSTRRASTGALPSPGLQDLRR